MSSGWKEMVVSNLERAVSTDIERLQRFKNADIAELFRYMINVTAQDDLQSGGVITEYTSVENPLRAEIINGLLVQPQIGTFDLLVSPGVLFALNPDSAPDDSNYKFVSDTGVSTLGALTMSANVDPTFTRIDIIEVQVTNAISEQDNRDVYNVITGLFTPTLLTKAVQNVATLGFSQTNVRVRTGTLGAGFPGTVSGWLPLCVAIVGPTTTSNDTITFYDVRPLISDRIYPPFDLRRDNPKISGHINGINPDSVTGRCYAELNGRRVGGRLRLTAPGTSTDVLALSTDNFDFWASGESMAAGGNLWNMYLAFPFGLPRWARYTDAPGIRKPQSPRGLIICTNSLADYNGLPTSPINMPDAYQLFGATMDAVAIVTLPRRFTSPVTGGCPWTMANDHVTWGSDISPFTNSSTAADQVASATGNFGTRGSFFSSSFGADVEFPGNAIAIDVSYLAFAIVPALTVTDTYHFTWQLSDTLGNVTSEPQTDLQVTLGASTDPNSFHAQTWSSNIEVKTVAPEGNIPSSVTVEMDIDNTAFGSGALRNLAIGGLGLVTGYRVSNW